MQGSSKATNGGNGRRPGLRYRVRRQDVRFMKRGAAGGVGGAR